MSSFVAAAQERPTHPFDREWLVARAQEVARGEHIERGIDAENALSELDYDQYRAIEFERAASIWRGEGRNFQLQLLHPGFIYRTPVDVNLVVGGTSRRVLYTTDVFEYGLDTSAAQNVPAPGYSGFRVLAPLNKADVWDEVVVFQGASYFRALGHKQRYGISARGLAVETAKAQGEEFPTFTEFWIERPAEGAERIVLHALLESRSVTGAYSFSVEPGDSTIVDVDAALFPRVDVASYGIAPLTSMFLFDATNRARFDDFRSAVHDSDGLQLVMRNGERVWRPLANPQTLQVSAFEAESPEGFGLMQRHDGFDDFEDIEARYELRPSLWIEPDGDWGEGHVELVEIPTDEEVHDNIVAFWQPAVPLRGGERRDFSYRMHWGDGAPGDGDSPRVVETRVGGAVRSDLRKFAVDYAAETVPQDLEPAVTTSAGRIVDARGIVVEATGTYRVNFTLDPDGEDLAEIRMAVTSGGEQWGETWLYRWTR